MPVVGEELMEAAHGVSTEALEDVAEACEETDLKPFACGSEARVARDEACLK